MEVSRVGHYRILGVLGHGGMGEVYLGLDETLNREVALKSIRAEWCLDPASRARFLREARTLSRLDHPNICRIHAYLQNEDRDYLVLELIRGRTLGQALGGRLDQPARMRIARQVAAVLTATHAEGIVHRDLKPGNVMLTSGGRKGPRFRPRPEFTC